MRSSGWTCVAGAVLTAAIGCLPDSEPADSSLQNSAEANRTAIVRVIEDVYIREGQQRIIFCDDALCEDAQMTATLEIKLGIKVEPDSQAHRGNVDLPPLTPELPATGEIGISISLGEFTTGVDGRLHVTATFVRSGLDGGVLYYVLSLQGGGWVIDSVEAGYST